MSSSDTEVGAELRVSRAWDLPLVTLSVGLAAGGAWLRQAFQTSGIAPTRDTPAGRFATSFGLRVPLVAGLSLGAESAAMTYVFAQQSGDQTSLGPWFCFRQLVGIEKEW